MSSLNRPLPIPGRDEKLPPPPPDSSISPPPSPPSKNPVLALDTHLNDGPQLPPIVSMSSLGFDLPQSPASPVGPAAPSMSLSSPISPTEKTKKSSPLADLIESEKIYVEYLTGIIRKVAAAWSRSNLPPPELDVMFRSVESVYKSNRTLLTRLKEIGSNPSSPKALGDLLMRWIDDLDRPYTTYCQKFTTGFDQWEPVKSNTKLPGVLEAFSSSNPPSVPVAQASRLADPSLWTLDALFLLPKGRLLYYRKLYYRLLKSTTPGRRDHQLLTGALEKLDQLLETLETRSQFKVFQGLSVSPSPLSPVTSHDVHELLTSPVTSQLVGPNGAHNGTPNQLLSGQFGDGNTSTNTSIRGSGASSRERFSRETEITSISRDSKVPLPTSVAELEKRVSTDTTLDIFTMQPKQIRLQICPPTLPYSRELKLSANVIVRFTPRSTGVDVIHREGFIYILSDLFLICEKLSLAKGVEGPDMRLCYPPLSGKVLKVNETPDQDNALQISIMRKETLILEADSTHARDEIVKEFNECIAFARAMAGAASEPVPPLPKGPLVLPAVDRPPAHQGVPLGGRSESLAQLNGPHDQAVGPSVLVGKSELPELPGPSSTTNFSLPHITSQQNFAPRQASLSQSVPGQVLPGNGNRSPSGEGVGARQIQSAQGTQRTPSFQNPPSGVSYPARKSSSAPMTNSSHPPPSFGPGQVIPPERSLSMTRSSPPVSDQDPSISGAPHRVHSPPVTRGYIQQQPLQHQSSVHSLQHRPSVQSLHHQAPPHLLHQRPSIHQYTLPPRSAPPQSHLPQQPVYAQPLPSRPIGPGGPPQGFPPPRPPSEPSSSSGRLHNATSTRSLHSAYEYGPGPGPAPPLPSMPEALPMPSRPYAQRKNSFGSINSVNSATTRPLLPSQQINSRANSFSESTFQDLSPPTSPIEEPKPLGPVKSTISESTKCRVFHQQQHAQWKALGSAQLTLYHQEPTHVKQLVVGSKDKTIISTIVLTDGVERVGKTGVAVELSDDKGARTGIIYMIQLRNEKAAGELFDKLLAGSDRSK